MPTKTDDATGWDVPTDQTLSILGDIPYLDEFLEIPFPPVRQFMGPMGSGQIVLLTAKAGVGKTQFAVSLAVAMGLGRDWGHWKCDERLEVLYLDGEMSGPQIQERFAVQPDARHSRVRVLNVINWMAAKGYDHINLAEPFWQNTLERSAPDADVIFVDNVMSLVKSPGVSMSSDEFWQPISHWCLKQRAAGRTVVLVDHQNSLGDTFGTKTKEWHADLVIKLDRPRNAEPTETVFHVKFSKVRGKRGEHTIPFEAKMLEAPDGTITWSRRWVDEAQMAEALELANDGMKQADIAKELNISQGQVSKLLKKARAIGLPDIG